MDIVIYNCDMDIGAPLEQSTHQILTDESGTASDQDLLARWYQRGSPTLRSYKKLAEKRITESTPESRILRAIASILS